MTEPASDHQLVVTAWLSRARTRRSAAEVIEAFEQVFAALWKRSHLTLGEVTLTAIVDRVLVTAKESFPALASVEVDETGLHCTALRSHAALHDDQLSSAFAFVLVEFLTVLGNLTAQILSPALHAELSNFNAETRDTDTTEDEASS